ncbi:7TM-DISM domain-containing protein [Flammeovirga aprica]|uniref:SpoIIE family protein phosphatase n=1 Tax=Flammeovirga aprica JL-4 TaxID=694437 RepID=A0A7X9XD69_9BACT|nr:7TM-DISM domain-containing protein [Flammeovirga aprica]NME72329.1 SpoIIE family protein phosphatase [Flammeovirga aprica JL-4]
MLKFLFACIGILCTINSYAGINEHKLTLKESKPYVNAASKAYFYIDPTNEVDFAKISSPTFTKFTPWKNSSNVSFEYGQSTYWVRVDIENEKKSMKPDWLVEVNYAPLDFVDYYVVKDGQLIDHVATGDHVSFNHRPIQHHNYVFPLQVEGTGVTSMYFKVKTDGSVKIPMRLYRPWKFAEINSKYEIGFGLFFGILVMMAVLGLITYLPTKDISYLIFPIPIIAKILFTFSLSGHTFQFLFPNNIYLANKITPLSIGIWMVGVSTFNLFFLRTRKLSPIAHKLNFGGLAIGVIAVFGALFLPYYTAIQIVTGTSIPFTMLSLGVGIVSYLKGNRFSGYYIASFSIYLTALLLFVGRMKGVVPDNLITSRILEYGDVIMVTLLFTALSKKYAIYREEKNIAINKMLQMEADAKATLELKVKERTLELQNATAELEEQKEELETQATQLASKNEEIMAQTEKLQSLNNAMNEKNDELEQQNEEIAAQRDMVEQKNIQIEKTTKNLRDSINYAKRIQSAILPAGETLNKVWEEYFLMYRPKDVVSGDFYWTYENERENKSILIVADCTGHGVPGAMMSMIGDGFLQQIVKLRGVTSPARILLEMNSCLHHMLQLDESTSIRDSMDMGVLVWDKNNQKVHFAGAHTPLVFVQNNNIYHLKGERLSLGSSDKKLNIKEHIIPLNTSTCFYLFSDGYQDQFGGENDRKISSKRLRELILMVSSKPMAQQKSALENFYETWVNANNNSSVKQIDDILLMGVKIKP